MKAQYGPDGAFKFCPGCKDVYFGQRAILCNFSRDARRSDGLQAYCRKCRKNGKGRSRNEGEK